MSMSSEIDGIMDYGNEENATQPLRNWEELEVSCQYEELNVSFRNILVRLEDVINDQIRNFSRVKRDNIMGTVRDSVQLTITKVNKRLEEIAANDKESFFDEIEMSEIELRDFLPKVSAHSRTLCDVALSLGCELHQVKETVNNKCETLDDLEKELKEREREIEDLKNQLSSLQEQVGHLEKGPSPPDCAMPTAGEKVDSWRAVRSHFMSLKNRVPDVSVQVVNESPHMSDGRHCTRSLASQNSSRQYWQESSPESTIGESLPDVNKTCRQEDGDPVSNMFSVFKEVFKTQCVAEVKKYSGKNSFSEFLRSLDVKFPSTLWRDSDRRDLLVNHLEGTALALYKGLPQMVREGTYEEVVNALKMARRNPCERLKNVREWEKLTKRPGESVTDFCCRMEDLSRKIHPSSEWDFIRGSKLYSCLQNWQNSYHMLAALDVPDGNVYTEVRRVALRLEKLQGDGYIASSRQGWSQNRMSDPEPTSPQKPFFAKGTTSQRATGFLSKASTKCYICGIEGHAAARCMKREKPKNRYNRESGNSGGPNHTRNNAAGGISLVSELDGWCKAVQRKESAVKPEPKAVGKPSTCEVEVFGMLTKGLVDTGSVISIIPVGLLKQARQHGVDLDAEACIVGDGKQRKLFDASGNPMTFLSEIVTEVRVKGGGTASIHMHVQQSKDSTILIGTNALQELGISVKLSPNPQEIFHSTGSRNESEPDEAAYADSRVVVAPGKVATVGIVGGTRDGACLFWSKDPRIESGVCQVKRGKAELSVVNKGSEPWVISRRENIGTWSTESWIDPKITDVPSDMMVLQQPVTLQDAERIHALANILNNNRKAGCLPDAVRKIIDEYSDVFAIFDAELTQTNLVTHDIDVGGHEPIRQKTRPVPYGIRSEVDVMLRDLKKRGVIEDSQSPWASPIVLVAKKDGTTRLCVDYREINKVTKKDSYPLPPIDITLQNLQGKQWFTSLDLANGYWQVPLTERAKEISAFTTTSGQFQFRVLPFGLTTAPAKFQRLMDKVLGDLLGPEVSVYIDDILIATDSVHRHVEVLRNVLEAFRKAHLKIKPQKCRIMEPSLEFLGHVVDASGVRADPEKVARIKEYPRPQNIGQLRTFLGMVGYYRKFVLKFSQISKPLFELTSPKKNFIWADEQEAAFEALKVTITEAPVLVQPNIEKARDGSRPFIIYTDASRVGIGAVLAQEGDDSLLHPVFFASKHLTGAEKNYHVTDQEALALVFSLKKFHYFIYGVPTIVRTDHSALTSLFKRTNVSPRVLRWALEVQRYDLTIEYVKGTANAVADALSRGLPPHQNSFHGYAEDEKVVCVVQEHDWLIELRQDPDFQSVIESIERDKIEEVRLPRHNKTLSTADFLLQKLQLSLINEDGSLSAVVPRSKRRGIFDESHSGILGGHFNAKKMFAQMRKTFFWPGMYQDLVTWCRGCQRCFLTNKKAGNVPPLRPIEVTRPLQIVGVDLLEMGLTTRGNRYIVTIIDHFTKYLGAYPVADKKAETIAEVIFSQWICGCGRWPETLLSDRGSEFENSIVSALCQVMGIEQKFTKGYCPRENGLTERVNGTIVRMLKKKTVVPAEWDRTLPTVVYAYNASPHRATGESPHFLLYGYDPIYPTTLVPSEHLSPYVVDYDKYKTELLCGLKLARECINENAKEYRDKMKLAYDRKYKTAKSTKFNVGDRVYMKLPAEKGKSRHPKLVTDWSGPFRIIEKSANSALVTLIGDNKDPCRVPFDHLVKLPEGIDNTPVTGSTMRGKRGRRKVLFLGSGVNKISSSIKFNFSSTLSSSNNVRHVDFRCPGDIEINGQRMMCGVKVPLEEILPNTPLTSYSFHSLFDLSRLITVSTQSHIPENIRLARLLDNSYDNITASSLGFAISFYRSRCIHVALASAADAGTIVAGFPPRSNMDPYNLPQMYDVAVRYADEHPWSTNSWMAIKPRRSLLLLPEGFGDVLKCFEAGGMSARTAIVPEDIESEWFVEEWSAVIMISSGQYADLPRWRNAWFLLMKAVSAGSELIILPGPRDDQDWGKTVDLLRDLAEETVAQRPTLKKKIRCLLPLKSQHNMIEAPFNILADKINLVTGRHFTQSAAKRFWSATLRQHSSILRMPQCKRLPEQKKFDGRDSHQQNLANQIHRQPRKERMSSSSFRGNRSLSRPKTSSSLLNRDFRSSLRGKRGRTYYERSGSAQYF